MQQSQEFVATQSGRLLPRGQSAVLTSSRVAFIEASWHADIVAQASTAFIEEICSLGISKDRVDIVRVPGAFEIPLHALELASKRKYQAIVGCAFVVNGGIYRHDFVAQTVVGALMQVQLQTRVPVLSVVLTPHHYHEHVPHQSFFSQHFSVKGKEAAKACVSTICSLAAISQGQ